MKESRHVIFLGAGASFTSGYPVGDGLRLRMSSDKHLRDEVAKIFKEEREIPDLCVAHFESFSDSVKLFRKGGFGTVDEFSKLASDKDGKHVQNMKRLMRLAFALHNPEDSFQDSDYYSFVQRLFYQDFLYNLRKDVTVITFNYDCYLEYLLLTAFEQRQQLSINGDEVTDYLRNKLTGGFWNPTEDFKWASQTLQFTLFKLHGSVAFGRDDSYGFASLFTESHEQRLRRFEKATFNTIVPPIVFPWELFDRGRFVNEEDFIFAKQAKSAAAKQEAGRLYRQFNAVWEGAKDAVSRADKISFVGLSMHKYLESGFAYLFNGMKKKKIQVVVANKENELFRNEKNEFHPLSPRGRVSHLLNRVAKELQWVRSDADSDGIIDVSDMMTDHYEPTMTARYSFRDFIEKELG